jgi:enamine deaminase RidA (YjgF/YER057c/UK114 family)
VCEAGVPDHGDHDGLPTAPSPQGRYVPAVVHAGMAYSAGMTPRVNGELIRRGIVGADVSAEHARELAGLAAGNALAAIADAVGGLENIERCVRLSVYIAAAPGFAAHTAIADGASERLHAVLGERGAAARSAIGVASLPSGAPLEVELTAAVRGSGQ